MRVFHIQPGAVAEMAQLPEGLPAKGFLWIACGRREFELEQSHVQGALHQWAGVMLVDLHISDLLNNQLPSHFDYTSQYDVLVFRRLAAGHSETDLSHPGQLLSRPSGRGGPPVLRRIDTSPVGFAVFDQLLLTVHPADCAVRDAYAARLLASLPTSNGKASATTMPHMGPRRSSPLSLVSTSVGSAMLHARFSSRLSRFGGGVDIPAANGERSRPQREIPRRVFRVPVLPSSSHSHLR